MASSNHKFNRAHGSSVPLKALIMATAIILSGSVMSQKFLNGSFEKHSASGDVVDQDISVFNSSVQDVVATASAGSPDIISTPQYAGGGYNSKSFIGLSGGAFSEIVALTLDNNLVQGVNYTLQFFDKAANVKSSSTVLVGVSSDPNEFGQLVYSTSDPAQIGIWSERKFSFIAPNNGQYITVKVQKTQAESWVHLDAFEFLRTYSAEVSSFTVQPSADQTAVDLDWETTSEWDNAKFIVQRSTDASNWEDLGEIAGAGNSNELNFYSFKDETPEEGRLYYRLTQIESSGKEFQSEVRTLKYKPDAMRLAISSTPVDGWVTVDSKQKIQGQIELFDENGNQTRIQPVVSWMNDNGFKVNLRYLPRGTYYLKVGDQTKRIIR